MYTSKLWQATEQSSMGAMLVETTPGGGGGGGGPRNLLRLVYKCQFSCILQPMYKSPASVWQHAEKAIKYIKWQHINVVLYLHIIDCTSLSLVPRLSPRMPRQKMKGNQATFCL